MGIMQDAIDDAAEFSSNADDFGVAIVLTSPTLKSASINGLSRKHHLKLDNSTGTVINSQNASVSVSEKVILAATADYPVRNSDPAHRNYQEVDMIDHLVEVADSSGVTKKYKCIENFADETLGLIVLILGGYEA